MVVDVVEVGEHGKGILALVVVVMMMMIR